MVVNCAKFQIMKRVIIIAIAAILASGISDLYGQDLPRFLGKRQDTAQKTVVNRLGREADGVVTKEVNKVMDKIFGKEEEPETPAESNQAQPAAEPAAQAESSSSSSRNAGSALGTSLMMRAMGMGGAANVKPVYEFDGTIEMTITNYSQGEQDGQSALYTTFIDSKSFDYGMNFSESGQDGASTVIFDTENNLMVTLGENDGERTGFAVGFTPDQAEAVATEYGDTEAESGEMAEESYDPYNEYRTGKKKKILGYSCDEYVIEDDETIVTMWITEDLQREMKSNYMQNATFAGLFMYAHSTSGTVLEYIMEDKKRDEKTVMQVTDIDMDKRKTISTAGYNIISMGAVEEEKTADPAETE